MMIGEEASMCLQLWNWQDIFVLIVQSSFVIGVTFVVLDRALYGIGVGMRYLWERRGSKRAEDRGNGRIILAEKKV
jgi:hypothetical protein